MKVERLHNNSPLYKDLHGFVSKHALLFNSETWLRNFPKENINECAILNNNNDVIGCFMYYEFRKAIFKFVITPPFAPHIGLFYLNPAESVVGKNSFTKDILDVLAAYIDSLKADYVEINLPDHMIDAQPFIWKGYTARGRYTYLIDLMASKEQLWDNLSSEKRKSVNRALKDALSIEETRDYKLVYTLVMQSLERNDKAKNVEVLKNILFSFSSTENSFAFVAYHNKVPIGVSYCVIQNDRAIYLFGGFNSENKHHGAGVSCMWQSILKAKELKLKYFDFEGSMNLAIERYFREFGGELKPYFCLEKTKPLLKFLFTLKGHKAV